MKTIKYYLQFILITTLLFFKTTATFAFAEDVCVQKSFYQENPNDIINCLTLPTTCETDQLSSIELFKCKVISSFEILATPKRSKTILAHRSLLHLDATYYLAEIIGYPTEDAYQIAIYDQSTDNGIYIPFNQQGNIMISDEELNQCKSDRTANDKCLLTTPSINGLMRNDFVTGGVLLHIAARYADKPTPPPVYPFDYMSTPDLEKQLVNLKNWLYGIDKALCVGGLVDENHNCITSIKEYPRYIRGYMPFLEPSKTRKMTLKAALGDFIINYENDTNGQMIPSSIIYSRDIDHYVLPQKGSNAKLGIFLHVLQDRYSHQKCTDLSYYTVASANSPNYRVFYNDSTCDQGSHMLWHNWEVGTDQSQYTQPENLTLKPALDATYDELLAYATSHGIANGDHLNKEQIINELLTVLEIKDATERLNALVSLFEKNGLTPLPGHGSTHST